MRLMTWLTDNGRLDGNIVGVAWLGVVVHWIDGTGRLRGGWWWLDGGVFWRQKPASPLTLLSALLFAISESKPSGKPNSSDTNARKTAAAQQEADADDDADDAARVPEVIATTSKNDKLQYATVIFGSSFSWSTINMVGPSAVTIVQMDDTEQVSTTNQRRRLFCCWRCSMPSLSKMPSAARQLVSNMLSFLSSPSPQSTVSEKGASFSTPQANRKNKVNGSRRMSDSNNVAYSASSKKVFEGNIEKWEPNMYEKELLRRTWSDEFDSLYELGSAIYCYIFDHNPNCKQLFPFISKYQGDEWKESKEFRSQALKFVQTLAQVVKNIYHMERTEPFLYLVGQKHVKFADRGFKHEYWDIFQDAMEFALETRLASMTDLDETQKKDAVTVWRTLALYTTVHMRNGFVDGLKGVNRFPPLI